MKGAVVMGVGAAMAVAMEEADWAVVGTAVGTAAPMVVVKEEGATVALTAASVAD